MTESGHDRPATGASRKVRSRIGNRPFGSNSRFERFRPQAVHRQSAAPTSEFGHKGPIAGTRVPIPLRVKKRTIEAIAAAHNDL
jgi:hypothetical protein